MRFEKSYNETHEWGKAVALSPEVELVKLCMTSLLEDTFYETSSETIERIKEYVNKVDWDFLLRLALFSRDYGLRSINHLLISLYIQKYRWTLDRNKLYRVLDRMIKRPDEMIEILGALNYLEWKFVYPNSLKSVYRRFLNSDKFDAYQLMKYKNRKGIISLYQLVNLTHPKSKLIDAFVKWNLERSDTWESRISKSGNNSEDWEELMNKNKLGTLAMLMNIRNMLKAWVNQDKLAEYVDKANYKWIFPFQVLRALWEVKEDINHRLLNSLSEIAYKSFDNLPLEWRTAVLVDTSWSMGGDISKNSSLSRVCLASFYGALVAHKWYDVYAWATEIEKAKILTWDWLLRIINQIKNINVWVGTSIQQAIDKVKDYDNVIVFSDMQVNDYVDNTWKIKNLFLFNLSWYKNSIWIKWNIVEVTGFSDKMFELWMDLKDWKSIVNKINKIAI